MKIYTRTGDDGTTGLIGGARVGKDDGRIEAYGTVDELNAVLGLVVCAARASGLTEEFVGRVTTVQNELFAVGSHLATPEGSVYVGSLPLIRQEWVTRLEGEIDGAQERLTILTQFILPGGTELAGRLHLARTVSRRAERLIVALGREEKVEGVVITYMNRLSDWLFVQARLANAVAGVGDVVWVKGGWRSAEC